MRATPEKHETMAPSPTKGHIQDQSPLSIDYKSLKFFAAGRLGLIHAIDKERILKEFYNKGINMKY
ncbi:predicted protein [Plenodomus lingam JN3]|uniref:Uncharacterized protein n=1 Tax=Leptosphaeria maculans (strain JN3 / isolate v23.1.3 / race Av1-4-5-6-7-8) TaxID=985895 RepID=E5A7S7_LEPMJ|nr:predicted protein [Plenodomus lingam JN3]CBX99672.1 predicted protein [Plenodomus lingam JN3]